MLYGRHGLQDSGQTSKSARPGEDCDRVSLCSCTTSTTENDIKIRKLSSQSQYELYTSPEDDQLGAFPVLHDPYMFYKRNVLYQSPFTSFDL